MSGGAGTGAAAAHWIASAGSPLRGEVDIPGDKSVSHRAVMFAALADGVTTVEGFLEGEDTRATAAIFERMGVRMETPSPSRRVVHGVGIDGLRAAQGPLDCGNAGTGMRLLAGLLAAQPFDSLLIGDASLSGRPMRRVIDPLQRMGARIEARGPGPAASGGVAVTEAAARAAEAGYPPLYIHASQGLRGIDFVSPVASAQLKSAVLLAGLYAEGETSVQEPHPTRDYTERMLQAFGVELAYGPGWARLRGGQRLRAVDVTVPADFSSAAFYIVAASVVPGSELLLRRVGLNPRRTGLLEALRLMGADIAEENRGEQGGEPVADLRVRYAPLRGIEVPEALVPDMIDEFPVMFVAAACAEGTTRVSGVAELRVKESDRLAVMATGLRTLGIQVDEFEDGALIHGGSLQSGRVESHGDHRISMSFAVAAQRASGQVQIDDVAAVATSFPDFDGLARRVGFGLAQG